MIRPKGERSVCAGEVDEAEVEGEEIEAMDESIEVEGVPGDEGGEARKVGQDEAERAAVKLVDPRMPSIREIEDHYLNHVPYRNWCPHCVKARGKDMDVRKDPGEGRALSEYS